MELQHEADESTLVSGCVVWGRRYAVEDDAAAARDVIAKVLEYPFNFKKGRRTRGADQGFPAAVEAVNAFVLGNSMAFFAGVTLFRPHNMPRRPSAKGTGDGGREADEFNGNTRAKAPAAPKGKEDTADPRSPKKRAAPAGANTSKAAKKNKTSAGCRVCRGRKSCRVSVGRTHCQKHIAIHQS